MICIGISDLVCKHGTYFVSDLLTIFVLEENDKRIECNERELKWRGWRGWRGVLESPHEGF